MRILLLNVNTTESMTAGSAEVAQRVAGGDTTLIPLTPLFGAESVEGNFESLLSAVAVMDRVATYPGTFDAIVLAGFGEHGREGLQEIVEVPVVDITEAAVMGALLLGRTYSVVTMHDRSVPLIEDRLKLAGLLERCASIRAAGLSVLETRADSMPQTMRAIAAEARRAVQEDRAEVICLGCAGLSGLREYVEKECGVPVVDGVEMAVSLAESLVRLGHRTSKVRTHSAPPRKRVIGWPITSIAAAPHAASAADVRAGSIP
jgi:allantoin racemase